MNEASKAKRHWGELEALVLRGKGIDIGCGPDPVLPDVRPFDTQHGDANRITKFVSEQYDFVFSSHCLEHMFDPRQALAEWWQLVKPGGYLFFIVPDEDLYEQGVFPSRFNPDHKATFTLSKATSWSPVSHNVLDLARELPGSELVKLQLCDAGYDRSLMRHGSDRPAGGVRQLARFVTAIARRFLFGHTIADNRLMDWRGVLDQTLRSDCLAHIECVVRKMVARGEGPAPNPNPKS